MASLQTPPEDQLLQRIKEVDEDKRVDFIKRENLHTWKNNLDETLLHFVANSGDIDMIKVLIEAQANVNAENSLGKTPIMLVKNDCEYGKFVKKIEILYTAKADIHTVFKCGKSAIQLALDSSDSDDLFFNNNTDGVHLIYLRILQYEFENNSEKIAKYLIDLEYSLTKAVLLGSERVIEHMILSGISVNSRDRIHKITPLRKAVQCSYLEIVEVLIKYNANVDLRDRFGGLPIKFYLCDGLFQTPKLATQIEIIKILLSKSNALKNLRHNYTVEQLQSIFENGNKEVIKILLDHYNDDNDILNIRDTQRRTPLHYLSINPHSDFTELLQNLKIDVDIRDFNQCTPLWTAAHLSIAHVNTFKFLLERKADVNVITDWEGFEVPLFALCHSALIDKAKYFDIIEIFLQCDLNIQYISPSQETVFDVIIYTKALDLAEPLLSHLAILVELKKLIIEQIRNQINSNQIFKSYFDACKTELAEMKNYIINDRLTLSMIVVNENPKMNEKLIINSCRFSGDSLREFQKLEKQYQSDNYYYNNIVKKRLSSIAIKLELLQKAAVIMCEIMELISDPQHLVLEEIIDYLDDQDLENLIKIQI